MPKPRVEFVCRECGYMNPRSLGRCPECEAWGSFDEVRQPASVEPARRGNGLSAVSASRPLRLADIDTADFDRLHVPMAEFARVLGGGIVKGSVTLIGGDPGVGKSTLLSQVADLVAQSAVEVLYVSGEESVAQVGLRARRMALHARDLLFLSETDADSIVESIRASRVSLAVIDSIQSVMAADVEALPGSVSQLRECALRFLQLAKSTGTPIFLVGHVTKDGAIAGPKVLEHMVDTVLYLEGERVNQYRLLRSTKNRFGPTHEVGVFEMQGQGLAEVINPSSVFLAERGTSAPGSVVTVAMEGTRPILQEIQALVSKSSLAMPRRTATGFDTSRLHLVTAVVGRRLGMPLYDQDVYLNVVGGLRVDEPSADLAAALAIVSSVRDRPIPADLVAVGELGLSGELRGVGQLEQRLREAGKLGFVQALVPRGVGRRLASADVGGIEVVPAATLREAVGALGL
ncbi:MAG: DNA repair protein RadA [Chloroflexota bacterium]|nr:DNA repair protein RadA [Chloroflexota bacterium]